MRSAKGAETFGARKEARGGEARSSARTRRVCKSPPGHLLRAGLPAGEFTPLYDEFCHFYALLFFFFLFELSFHFFFI